jgi:hypothetical protein
MKQNPLTTLPEYVKEFPNIKGDTLEDYARNLEKLTEQYR